jgi:phosphohistidine phosphatase
MHQLLLLRHAKSAWDDPSLTDRDRPLSKRGKRAIAAMRDAMRELELTPDVVLLSPSRRTRETLEGLEPWDSTPLIEPIERLYLASIQDLLSVLHEVNETVRSLMLIGHNPGMHELATQLMMSRAATEAANRLAASFPTAALAEFSIAGPWARLDSGGGQLIRYLTPRDLREAD